MPVHSAALRQPAQAADSDVSLPKEMQLEQGVGIGPVLRQPPIYDRHPEARAKRASKEGGPGPTRLLLLVSHGRLCLHAPLRRPLVLRRFGHGRRPYATRRGTQFGILRRIHLDAQAGAARLVRAFRSDHRCHRSRAPSERLEPSQEGGTCEGRLAFCSTPGEEASGKAARAVLKTRCVQTPAASFEARFARASG
jgi:hypothetical protein